MEKKSLHIFRIILFNLSFWCALLHIVYDLKSVGALEIKFVAPIPEQIATTTRCPNKQPRTLSIQPRTIDMCLLRPQGNALLGSHFVLAWVLRLSNFGPSGHRLICKCRSLVHNAGRWCTTQLSTVEVVHNICFRNPARQTESYAYEPTEY